MSQRHNLRDNCTLEGADYAATYSATISGNALKLNFVTVGQYATNTGSRLYLLDTDTSYQQFNLLNSEFTFDVDVSNFPCGLNGALYFCLYGQGWWSWEVPSE